MSTAETRKTEGNPLSRVVDPPEAAARRSSTPPTVAHVNVSAEMGSSLLGADMYLSCVDHYPQDNEGSTSRVKMVRASLFSLKSIAGSVPVWYSDWCEHHERFFICSKCQLRSRDLLTLPRVAEPVHESSPTSMGQDRHRSHQPENRPRNQPRKQKLLLRFHAT